MKKVRPTVFKAYEVSVARANKPDGLQSYTRATRTPSSSTTIDIRITITAVGIDLRSIGDVGC